MTAFATAADLAGDPDTGQVPWLSAAHLEQLGDDVERVLQRASEVVAEAATAGYLADLDGAPVHTWDADALRDATCAQVEQWLEVGEENDIAGYSRGTSIGVAGGLNLSALPSILAPRARRILRAAGLVGARAW